MGIEEGYPRLLGDVGGTNVRWALQADASAALSDVRVAPCADSGSLQQSAQAYLRSVGAPRVCWAGIGIACPVAGDQVRMTNLGWEFSQSELRQALNLERLLLVNDFTALALSLPALTAGDLQALGQGVAVAGAPMALLGAGTGLGVSGLVADRHGHYVALGGEGGHVTLAATDAAQEAVIGALRVEFAHVSAERVLSGSGLVNLYRAVCRVEGVPARALTPSDVSAHAVSGSDPQCLRTIQFFTQFLGSVAGNLALTLGARAGVYLGGGIVPKLGTAFDAQEFRQHFEHKGRFAPLLAAMPLWIITAATPALIGASRALDQMA